MSDLCMPGTLGHEITAHRNEGERLYLEAREACNDIIGTEEHADAALVVKALEISFTYADKAHKLSTGKP